MPDYKKMYFVLFDQVTKSIEALQRAQQVTEALYIEASGDGYGEEDMGDEAECCEGNSPR